MGFKHFGERQDSRLQCGIACLLGGPPTECCLTARHPCTLRQAVMHVGQKVHGAVCPGEMIYHYFDNTYGIAADIAAGYDNDNDDEEDDGHRRRRLAATEADSDAHSVEEHDSDAFASENIRFKLLLHTGRVEYSVAQLEPLLKMVPPNRNADYQIHSLPGYDYINIDICDAQRGMQYLVLKGLETCAGEQCIDTQQPPSASPSLAPRAPLRRQRLRRLPVLALPASLLGWLGSFVSVRQCMLSVFWSARWRAGCHSSCRGVLEIE